ncbi:hypothetical protein FIE12Z_3705 [Fusarium flagelliforme]|uniref:C3H1-type domain-containing protein n=1 Tax=Fusarium flagelliforme TaxID=2675880 RepID=A0A395MWA4_9HYPO|nr:hypothetical protein FIE12Z_3705 [Fusarium flagelliforme]
MRFANNAPNWQPPAPQNFSGIYTSPSTSVAPWQTGPANGNLAAESSTEGPNIGVDNDAMEEGELSEGELEDIYEPGEMERNTFGKREDQPSGFVDQCNRPHMDNQRTWNSKYSGRERSGSYSPYLSPREIQLSGQENGASNTQTPRRDFHDSNNGAFAHGDNTALSHHGEARDMTAMVSETKKHAREAILRLWPLKVRYHNYIEEGVDQTLLDQLFVELGLDLETTVPRSEQSNLRVPVQGDASRSDVRETVPPLAQATILAIDTESKAANSAKDKAEERKDRIARLLAAKGSKAPADADANKSAISRPLSTDTPNITKSDKTKTQSEKSKLIQQKIEALMKAREASAKATQAPALPVSSIAQPVPDTSRSNSQVPVEPMNPDDYTDATMEKADSSTGPPIPGLFLSSNAPSPAPSQRKRPVAADLNENSTPSIPKRPFGQARESRPFLIDVSDDEDDAEMDIDSPELRASSVQRPTAPGSRTLSFRDNMTLPDGASRGTSGMIDLASMNKKIEDMRRRIAEAEARKKKAKQSGGNSPLPQSGAQSKEGSVDANTRSVPAEHGLLTTSETVQTNSAPSAPQSSFSSNTSTKLPKVRDGRYQARPSLRARVASERLPIVTAQRMECQEQLKHFQSEVDRVKKEIENKLVEEERLRKDALQAEPVLSPGPKGQNEFESGSESESVIVREEPPVVMSQQVPTSYDTSTPAQNDKMNDSHDEAEQDALMDESSCIVLAKSRGGTRETADDLSSLPADPSVIHGTVDVDVESATDIEEPEEDIAMDEAVTSSEEESAAEDESDDYEPTDAVVSLPDPPSSVQRQPSSQQVSDDSTVLETSDTDLQGLSTATPVTKPISTGTGDSESESNREVDTLTFQANNGADDIQVKVSKHSEVSNDTETTFVPYETPLQYFKAYRFHPQYSGSVAGGLRSLTYSNNIDATREVCPDQLTHEVCPRGSDCQFQHFEDMQLPGAYGNSEVEQQDQYVAGLRQLLTDFRNRKVKDFQAISQGLIEYRARFLRDKTKILPLGGVTL